MTIEFAETSKELQEYATSIGIGLDCENANKELIIAIFTGIITDKISIDRFTGF